MVFNMSERNRRVKITVEFTITGTSRVRKADKKKILGGMMDSVAKEVYGYLNLFAMMSEEKDFNKADIVTLWEDKIIE